MIKKIVRLVPSLAALNACQVRKAVDRMARAQQLNSGLTMAWRVPEALLYAQSIGHIQHAKDKKGKRK